MKEMKKRSKTISSVFQVVLCQLDSTVLFRDSRFSLIILLDLYFTYLCLLIASARSN